MIIALLIRKERGWLLGKLNLSKPYEYGLKSTIKNRIRTLVNLELPLLIKNNLVISDEPESREAAFGDVTYDHNSSLGKAKAQGVFHEGKFATSNAPINAHYERHFYRQLTIFKSPRTIYCHTI